jgi:hypothetical protein
VLLALAAPALATSTVPQPEIVYPDGPGAVSLTPMLIVSQPVGYGAGTVVLVDEAGLDVPFTLASVPSVDDGVQFDLVVPDAPLADGASYTLSLEVGTGYVVEEVTFGASALATPPVAPPVPVTRDLLTDRTFTGYGSSTVVFDTVRYRLCSVDEVALFVVGEGATEPPAPTPVAPGDVWAAARDSFDLGWVLDLGPGDAATLWFGAFDRDGGFSGWTGPDALVMPASGCTRLEEMPGREGGGTTTPTAFSECPPFGAWAEAEPESCPAPLGGDTGASAASSSCGGCRSGSMAGGWLAVGLALVPVLRRRRAAARASARG